MRRTLLTGLALLAVLLAGCSGPAGPDQAAPGDGGAFPVTITHGQGTVTVPARPQRVVVLGFADAQIASALGVPVVAAARNPAAADGNWAATDPPLPPEVLTLDSITPNIEAIAAAQPDLILMTTAQPSFSAAYDRISAIAPTVSYATKLLEDSGDDLARIIGRATGHAADADALIARSDAAIAAAADRLTGVRGKAYAFGQFVGGTTYVVVAPSGPTASFFGRLGMRIAPGVADLPIFAAGIAKVPPERLSALGTADVAFMGLFTPEAEQQFRAQPLLRGVTALQDGRFRPLTVDESSLMLGPNPASTQAILDVVEPTLAAATAG